MTPVLDVHDLSVGYHHETGVNVVLVGVDLELHAGQLVGLAGESGCGKSTAALSVIGFPIPGSVRLSGAATFEGDDLFTTPVSSLRRLWGSRLSYVAQDASAALNPLQRVERLLCDPLELHLGLDHRAARDRAVELLARVGIADAEGALRRYPHQFSGGQQQRIALAIALSCRPAVLVLDEPTTGLDVTTQAQISELILELVRESGAAALAISHDLALLSTICDDIVIMYAGEIVERAPAESVYSSPRHPYSAALLDAAPSIDSEALVVGIPGLPPPEVIVDRCSFAARCRFAVGACETTHPELSAVGADHDVRCVRADDLGPIASAKEELHRAVARDRPAAAVLEVRGVHCTYRGRHDVTAVDDVSLSIDGGETLAIVGGSGSGKSTLLRAVAGLHAPDSGEILFRGQPLPPRAVTRSREVRRSIQLVFQNPDSSLNPRHTIRMIIERPVSLFRPDLAARARLERILELLADVRLDANVLARYPAQLSGGQKQRVALARAFAAEPELILCDEVVSALDVSVQASILELLATLAHDRDTALLFVTHDLAVVRSIADRVAVMRDGNVLEQGATRMIFEQPTNQYTRELLAAVPRPGARVDVR